MLGHDSLTAGRIFATLGHELDGCTAWADAAAHEGQDIVVLPGASGIRTGHHSEQVSADTAAAGHYDSADQCCRDGCIDGVAAARQDAQAGGRDQRMLAGNHPVARQGGTYSSRVATALLPGVDVTWKSEGHELLS